MDGHPPDVRDGFRLTEVEPRIYVAETGPRVDGEVIKAFFDDLRALALETHYALVVDAADLRDREVQFSSAGAAAIRGMLNLPTPTATSGVVGCALTIPSFEVRAITGVVLTASKPRWPTRIVRDRSEALVWCRRWIAEIDGRAIPAPI